MQDQEEYWKYVFNFPEYVVSNYGKIKRAGDGRGRPLTQTIEDDVVYVMLHADEKEYHLKLERIVAMTFHTNLTAALRALDVVHKDGNSTNCRADNLEWSDE